jgi:hypothetical protein
VTVRFDDRHLLVLSLSRWPTGVNSSEHQVFKKRRLGSPEPPDSDVFDANWDLLWQTFWGQPATECFVRASTCIPDPRTLETPTEETNFEYLKLPTDEDFFPCHLRRILVTETYKSMYKLLCEEDRLYAEMPESKRLISVKQATVLTGQPGTGERNTAFIVTLNKWDV